MYQALFWVLTLKTVGEARILLSIRIWKEKGIFLSADFLFPPRTPPHHDFSRSNFIGLSSKKYFPSLEPKCGLHGMLSENLVHICMKALIMLDYNHLLLVCLPHWTVHPRKGELITVFTFALLRPSTKPGIS